MSEMQQNKIKPFRRNYPLYLTSLQIYCILTKSTRHKIISVNNTLLLRQYLTWYNQVNHEENN